MNLQEQLAAVQSKLNAERELGGQKDADKIAALEAQEADITRQIMEQAQQERVQAQEQAVESIELPYDFNDVLDNPAANEMIIEVVKDVKRQADAEHNAEVDKINAEWSDKLRAAADREAQLKRQNDEIQSALETERKQAVQDAKEYADMLQQLAQLGLEKQDAEAKRNAAVAQKEGLELMLSEKQEEIDLLRNQLANSAAPKSAFDITPTDKLAQMVKETNDIKAARGLARWNQTNPELAVTPLEIPVFPSPTPLDLPAMEQNTDNQAVESEKTFPEDSANTEGLQVEGNGALESLVGQVDQESQVTTLESLKAEVDTLKAQVKVLCDVSAVDVQEAIKAVA